MPCFLPSRFLLCEKSISLENKEDFFLEGKGFLLQKKWISFVSERTPLQSPALRLHQNHSLIEIPENQKNYLQPNLEFTWRQILTPKKSGFWMKIPGSGGRSLPQLPDRVPKNLSRIWRRKPRIKLKIKKTRGIKNSRSKIFSKNLTWDILLWETSPSRAVYRTP